MIVYRFLVCFVAAASFVLEARADSLARDLETPSEAPVANKSETFIEKLWRENNDLVDKFLNNTFIKCQAYEEENKTLASYKRYSLQDYYYLLDFVKYQALRLAAFPDLRNLELETYLANETNSMKDLATYASGFRNDTLIKNLTLTPNEIDNGTRTPAELAYSNWLQKNEDSGWFTLYVKSIPCVYGWPILAQKYDHDKNTNKNTTFYETWIKPNMNDSAAGKLSALLDRYVPEYETTYMYTIWNSTLREALQFEINFFNDALNNTLSDSDCKPKQLSEN